MKVQRDYTFFLKLNTFFFRFLVSYEYVHVFFTFFKINLS